MIMLATTPETKGTAAKTAEGFHPAEEAAGAVLSLLLSVAGGSIPGLVSLSGAGEDPGSGAAVALGSHSSIVV